MDDERWRLFPVMRADTSGLLIVDTELLELAPLAELPIAVLGSLELEPEMSKPATDRLEDALQIQIERAGGRPAGHLRSADELLSIGYLPMLPDDDLQLVMSNGWTDLNFLDDPDWTVFADLLAVTPREEQAAEDLRVVVELSRLDDRLSEPRPVDYQVMFPVQASADAFVDEVRPDGFLVSASSTHGDRIEVQLTRTDSIGWPPEGISELVWHVRSIAETHGGSFTGWGSPIVAEDEPPKRRWWKK